MTPDPTLIKQVARAIHQAEAGIAISDADWQSMDNKHKARRLHQAEAAIATLQGSAALPSEAIYKRIFLAGHSDGWIGNQQRRDLEHIDAEKGWSLYVKDGALDKAMRATTPTAPVQDDDAERLMREFYLSASYDPKAKRPADNVKAAIAFALLSRLSTPETGLALDLWRAMIRNGVLIGGQWVAVQVHDTNALHDALSNVSPDEALTTELEPRK